MLDDAAKAKISAAIRLNEIGNRTPYELSFAGKGSSGASFGFMQADLATGRAAVGTAFRAILKAASMDESAIDSIYARLSRHLLTNPLSPAETAQVNAALQAGSAQVDALDQLILGDVYHGLDQCLDAATTANRTITLVAQAYIAQWINMTGPPSTLLHWLGGESVSFARPVPPIGAVVDEAEITAYMLAQHYFIENPQNFTHMKASADAGVLLA